MEAAHVVLLALTCVGGCGGSFGFFGSGDGNATPHSYDGLAGTSAEPGNTAAIEPLRAIARPRDVDGAYLDSLAAALDRSVRESSGDLTTADRVRLQHELLAIANALEPHRRTFGSSGEQVYGRVMAYARSIAPTASAIAALGAAEHPAVSGFLDGDRVVHQLATTTWQRPSAQLVAVSE